MITLFTISDRKFLDRVISIIHKETNGYCFELLGRGTANSEMINYLGLNSIEKGIVVSIFDKKEVPKIFDKLKEELEFGTSKGIGVAFTVPISSMTKSSLVYLENRVPVKKKKSKGIGDDVDNKYKYQLILAICNNGFAGDIVDTVRGVGARGATILHARGSASEEMKTFFNIKIHPEKEIILIVSSNEKKDELLKAIANNHGLGTDAGSVCLSLPVEDGLGFSF